MSGQGGSSARIARNILKQMGRVTIDWLDMGGGSNASGGKGGYPWVCGQDGESVAGQGGGRKQVRSQEYLNPLLHNIMFSVFIQLIIVVVIQVCVP